MEFNRIEQFERELKRELGRDDWPHRRTCQMLKPVPDGLPWSTMTCNCDASSTWMQLHDAALKLIAGYRAAIDERAKVEAADPRSFEDADVRESAISEAYATVATYEEVLVALAVAHGLKDEH